ncbi:hypothetical protein ACFVXE_12695 [Streptomyces sp. NPDC058231]|uniref:hypothetical protein n=1 Tax=Streptomyces sp. NPDC058231 TaxID=3346392 RepID=UPI0036E54421
MAASDTRHDVPALAYIAPRFPRRLIAERRIVFVKMGWHVRIPESALTDFVAMPAP